MQRLVYVHVYIERLLEASWSKLDSVHRLDNP